MTKSQFVDLMRGPDHRDKNPNLRRIIPEASLGNVIWATVPFVSMLCLLVSLIFAIYGVCTQHYELLWSFIGSAIAIILFVIAQAVIGSPQYEQIQLTIQDLRTYKGEHVYIHFLNNVTGYEDGWYPFYGATEEFVRISGGRPEVCVAPFEQYARGWVAYPHQMDPNEFKSKGREPHAS